MEKETRKASDVLLDLESKIDSLLSIIRSQDLNIKLLSNKLNTIMEKLDKTPITSPQFKIEAVNTASMFTEVPSPEHGRAVPISSEFKLPVEDKPQGFRRTSRPETFSGDNAFLNKSNSEPNVTKFPMQMPNQAPPGRSQTDVIVPPAALANKSTVPISPKQTEAPTGNFIPVQQRVVNKNGKSIFMADVEITNLETNEKTFKTRTAGTGKWAASLLQGSYRIVIQKKESMNGEKLEAIQDINVDGSKSPLELPMMIIK